MFQNWEHAQLQLTKRRENKTRTELAGRNDKVEQFEKEVEEVVLFIYKYWDEFTKFERKQFQWDGKVQKSQKDFEEISAEIKRETERFEIDRIREFKSTIVKYLEDQMAHQQQVIKYWVSLSFRDASICVGDWSAFHQMYLQDAFVPNAKEINWFHMAWAHIHYLKWIQTCACKREKEREKYIFINSLQVMVERHVEHVRANEKKIL